jgi:hypothetical protein
LIIEFFMTDGSNYSSPAGYFLSSIVIINSNFNLAHGVIKDYLFNELLIGITNENVAPLSPVLLSAHIMPP